MTFKKIPFGTAQKFNVVIEVPSGSKKKYEYDPEMDAIKLNKVFYGAAAFPLNYGHIPKSISGDNSLLDAFVISTHPFEIGTVAECRPVGLVGVIDRGKKDNKILAVPVAERAMEHYQDLADLPPGILQQIEHFYEHLKLEEHPEVLFQGFADKEQAVKELIWAQEMED